MLEMFTKHVLGVDKDCLWLYGKTVAYYANVEQQGRLTLHPHMFLSILNSSSLQKMDPEIWIFRKNSKAFGGGGGACR